MSSLNINSDLLRKEFKKNNISVQNASMALGYAKSSLSACIAQETMSDRMLEKVSTLLGLKKEELIKPEEEPIEPKTEELDKESVSTENAEIIVTYIQDVGKILCDVVREIREDRSKTCERLDAICKELHELSVGIKNENADRRATRNASNNALQMINNNTQAMLGVVRARK